MADMEQAEADQQPTLLILPVLVHLVIGIIHAMLPLQMVEMVM
jgi:hypothetical protein